MNKAKLYNKNNNKKTITNFKNKRQSIEWDLPRRPQDHIKAIELLYSGLNFASDTLLKIVKYSVMNNAI